MNRQFYTVFCSKCGAANVDGAGFCQSCGTSLATATSSPYPSASSPWTAGTSPHNPQGGKSPPIAAFLNLFWGVGYLYLGYKRVLGVPAIAFVILAIVVYFFIGIFTIGIGSLIIAILFAVDGWQKASGSKGFINAE
ncbi:MAG: zinc ribbon domain-containing protein [Thaumarchaeota archaeon]|nr:zinc ribbon domain-containing protein [Nitrososphaerota archaeon]